MGDATAVNGVFIGGVLHVNTNVIPLSDANDPVLDSGALVTLGDGTDAPGQIIAANGILRTADYAVWRDSLNAPAGTLLNDFAGGIIGSAQYQAWVANFGATQPSQTIAVPEPMAVVIMPFLAGLAMSTRRSVI